jgi:hypothetical protein
LLHILMCETMHILSLQKNRGRFPVPGTHRLDSESLLHLIQFHAVPRM